jgi:hypothetical protein
MASTAKPGDEDLGRTDGEINRTPQADEPVNEEIIADGADEAVYQGRHFPSGGGEGAPDRGGPAGGPDVATGAGGSTGRGATDAGKTDSAGTPGGGMTGAAGG